LSFNPAMAKIKLYFSYDGTHYHGWQKQNNTPHTIQEVLNNKLSMVANARVATLASGRTDAGVHARVQVAHAIVPDTLIERLIVPDGTRLKQSLNSLLPPDIRILLIEQVPESFNALADTLKKTYLYFIDPSSVQWPQLRDYAWHLRFPLNYELMDEASKVLVGRHDFKALCASDSTAKTTVRTVHEAYWDVFPWQTMGNTTELRVFRITGTGFLKGMVRCIVGSLVAIGNGKAKPDLMSRCLETCDRKEAGPTAPPHGLWLWDVLYKPPAINS
jgi:tRNA pseudouridine38-40 synthase